MPGKRIHIDDDTKSVFIVQGKYRRGAIGTGNEKRPDVKKLYGGVEENSLQIQCGFLQREPSREGMPYFSSFDLGH